MLYLTLLSMVASTAPAVAVLPSIAVRQDEPQVRVWLNKRDNVDFGERVRVYVQTQSDGHLVVLHADPEGRVRILQPVNPVSDDVVRAGRAYEVKGPGNREAFRAQDVGGVGIVYVAYSPEPFVYDVYRRANQWDPEALGVVDIEGNTATEQLTELVQGMSPSGGFIYDLVDYYVAAPVGYETRARYYDDAYYRDPYYYDPYYYDPYYYRYRPYRFGWSLHFGHNFGFGFGYYPYRYRHAFYYDPFYWDPFYWDPFYSSSYWYPRSWYSPRYYYPTVIVAHGTVRHQYTFRTNEPGNAAGYRRRAAPGTVAASGAVTLRRSVVNDGSRRRLASTGNDGTVSGRRVSSPAGSAVVSSSRRTGISTVESGRRVVQRTPSTAQPVQSGTARRATGSTAVQPADRGAASTRRATPSTSSGSVAPRTANPARRPSADVTPAARRPVETPAASTGARRTNSSPVPSRREVQAVRAGEERGSTEARRAPGSETRTTAPVRATPTRGSIDRQAIPARSGISRGSPEPARSGVTAERSRVFSRPSLQRRTPSSERSSAVRSGGSSPTVRSTPRSSGGSSVRSAPVRRPSGSASASSGSSGRGSSAAPTRRSGGSSQPSRGSSGTSGRRRGGGS